VCVCARVCTRLKHCYYLPGALFVASPLVDKTHFTFSFAFICFFTCLYLFFPHSSWSLIPQLSVGVRGSPPVKWEDRLLECLKEREDRRLRGIEGARVECMDRSKWRLFCRGHPLEGVPWNRRQIRLDYYTGSIF